MNHKKINSSPVALAVEIGWGVFGEGVYNYFEKKYEINKRVDSIFSDIGKRSDHVVDSIASTPGTVLEFARALPLKLYNKVSK